MVLLINGVATIPNIYKSVDGSDIALRQSDLQKIAENYVSNSRPLVVNHDDKSFSNEKGRILSLGVNDEGQLTYEAYIDDEVLENQVKRIYASGKTPNVSPQLVPVDGTVSKLTLDDGSEVHYADEWKFEHLSIVNKGRCDDTQGCGVHNIQEVGDITMSDETDALKLELEKLKEQMLNMESEKEALELKLSEVTKERDEFIQKEIDEYKALILSYNKEADLSDINDIASLKIVLSKLEDMAEGNAKEVTDEEPKSAARLRLEAAKKAREEKFMIR